MKDGSRLTEHVRAGMRAHVRVQRCLGGGGGADPPEGGGGRGAAICFSFGQRPALTGLRVETGTNEQLHPACPPGIMGLQTVRGSVCASFLHFLFAPFAFSLVSHRYIPPPTISFFFSRHV